MNTYKSVFVYVGPTRLWCACAENRRRWVCAQSVGKFVENYQAVCFEVLLGEDTKWNSLRAEKCNKTYKITYTQNYIYKLIQTFISIIAPPFTENALRKFAARNLQIVIELSKSQ